MNMLLLMFCDTHLQGIIYLPEKGGLLFTRARTNAFYEAILSSNGSVTQISKNHRPDDLEKLQSYSSLL